MAGSNKKVTEDRYNVIKSVITSMPPHANGLGKVYDAFGISSSTASYIGRSTDYNNYQELVRRRAIRQQELKAARQPAEEAESPASEQPVGNLDYITAKLNSIENHLTQQDRELAEFKELYQWVADHAVLDTKKKWFNK